MLVKQPDVLKRPGNSASGDHIRGPASTIPNDVRPSRRDDQTRDEGEPFPTNLLGAGLPDIRQRRVGDFAGVELPVLPGRRQ